MKQATPSLRQQPTSVLSHNATCRAAGPYWDRPLCWTPQLHGERLTAVLMTNRDAGGVG